MTYELNSCFGWLLQTTWRAAVIAVIILLAQWLLRNRLSPAWRHGLWFLLVARLLMPMTPSSAVSVFNLAKWPRRQATLVTGAAAPMWTDNSPAQATFSRTVGTADPRAATPERPTPAISFSTGSANAAGESPAPSVNWMKLAALAWMAGVLVLTLRLVCVEGRFRRRLARSAPASDETAGPLLEECARTLRVKEPVQVIETEEVDSPAVYGLWRKRLLLPEGLREELSAEELRHVLLHELAHIKRRDPELNWLLVILQILHWFNPVLWFAFARARGDRELATDDLALAHTQERERKSYGETILKVLEGLTPQRVLPGLVGIAESKAQIRARIRAIARGSGAPRWRWAACAAAAVIAGVALTNAREEGQNKGINLLERYPTTLTAGDTSGSYPWSFSPEDIFQVSKFSFAMTNQLRIETGVADLGVGHCAEGAVWAVVIPREGGNLTSPVVTNQEEIAHVWLRFHPGEIARLFPADTVTAGGDTNLAARFRAIAQHKFHSSWHRGDDAIIPEHRNMTVDVDTKEGQRRFFMVDTDDGTAKYAADFEGHGFKQPPPITAEVAQSAFDQIWDAFDQKYAGFVLRPEVDWAKQREEYRPKALASKSSEEFAAVCAEMLKPLRDLHVWITLAGSYVPVYNRPRQSNSNPSAHRGILGSLNGEGQIQWAITADKIGYIAINGWNDGALPEQFQEVLEKMRDTRGLIIDVRLNGGGGEPLAQQVAARFVRQKFVYAYSQYRNGPKHTDLTGKNERTIEPGGPWRYDRPVILLIGQKCMSSNESFVGMMTGDPDLTTMGDHTCGSSGNPQMINVAHLAMTVSVPQWIDYMPDGRPLDERGFEPQVPFTAKPGAFQGQRDDLLTAALERLRQAPLPEQPIGGPAYLSPEKAEVEDASRPKVVSVWPAEGASGVATAGEIKIRFDRPMDALAAELHWSAGGFTDCDFPQYDSATYEFTIPVHLKPDKGQEIVVNNPLIPGDLASARASYPSYGFLSADHRLARRFVWHFHTGAESPTPKADVAPTKAATPEPTLLELLASMKEAHGKITSFEERVQTLMANDGNEYHANGAYFRRQSSGQFYGDVSEPMLMCSVFRIGCDGLYWWWQNGNSLTVCPVPDMQEVNACLCDPFDLESETPAATIAESALKYAGRTNIGGADCYCIASGTGDNPAQWWIDAETLRPIQLRQDSFRTRFYYDSVNNKLAEAAFAVPKLEGVTPSPPEPLGNGYTHRFVNVRDGSDGRMSVRWGMEGPGGRSSSGLN
jgi:beta-lactamase regulating signal transducer with metallopeptidase domain